MVEERRRCALLVRPRGECYEVDLQYHGGFSLVEGDVPSGYRPAVPKNTLLRDLPDKVRSIFGRQIKEWDQMHIVLEGLDLDQKEFGLTLLGRATLHNFMENPYRPAMKRRSWTTYQMRRG